MLLRLFFSLLLVAPGLVFAAGFDQSAFDRVLHAYVKNGLVNYSALKAERSELDSYLGQVAKLSPETYETWGDSDKIAFWINAYNAITLQSIINNYPISASGINRFVYPSNSIRQISGVWDSVKHPVMGQEMTLEQIEHETLRKKFKEPRIHVALVCAAKGCPLLRSEAYLGEKLEEQLSNQAELFVRSERQFKWQKADSQLSLSSILKWFGDDFVDKYYQAGTFANLTKTENAALNFVCRYQTPEIANELRATRFGVAYLDYDWSLNEQ